MRKRANYQGNVIADTSPSGIEKYLKTKIENALGDQVREGVKITPLLQVEDYKEDMSGDVKSGYGAIAINVEDTLVHVPFIIKDNEFLPFDSIRMGEQQVPYEEAKLRKLIGNIKKVKGRKEEYEEDPFNTMSLGDIKDLPFDNGFLGTIMGVRDSARQTNNRNQSNFVGNNFGHIEDERMINLASEDIGLSFENFHEKLAAVNVYEEEDLIKVAENLRDKAIKEYNEILNAKSRMDEKRDKTNDLYRKQLQKVELVDIDIAANGKLVEFPTVEGETTRSRSIGKLFRKLHRISGKKSGDPALKGFDKLLLDARGFFKLINNKDRLLIYKDRRLSEPKIKLGQARSMVQDNHKYYSFFVDQENDEINVPFRVIKDFVHTKEEDGRIKSFTELNSDGGTFFTSSQSSMFQNVLVGEEILETFADFKKEFLIVISREGSDLDPGIYTDEQIRKFIISHAKGERDLNVSLHMFDYFPQFNTKNVLVLKPGTPILRFNGVGIPTIERREELVGIEKSAAFDEQNKVRVFINERNYPPTYNVNINYVVAKGIDGMIASNVEQNNINNLSEAATRKVLNDIGVTHTEIDEVFESVKRSGRYAELPLPNVEIAKTYEFKEPMTHKVKKAIEGMVRNTLNAKRYTPILEDVVADSISDAARSILRDKYAHSLEVAQMMEKRANETRDKFDVSVAMLLNMKHGLDKLATDIIDGYVTNGEEVFEELLKVSHYISPISEELYYRQFRGSDDLYKEAMYELDDLSRHAVIGNHFVKEARIKKLLTSGGSKKFQTPKKKEVVKVKRELDQLNKEIDEKMKRYDNLVNFLPSQPKRKDDVNNLAKDINSLLVKRNELTKKHSDKVHDLQNQNRAILGAVGIPGITAGSYYLNKEED